MTSVSLLDIRAANKKREQDKVKPPIVERKSTPSIIEKPSIFVDTVTASSSNNEVTSKNDPNQQSVAAQTSSPVNLYEDAKRRLRVVKNKENNEFEVPVKSSKAVIGGKKTPLKIGKSSKTPLKSRYPHKQQEKSITKRTPLVERKRNVLQARQLHLSANV